MSITIESTTDSKEAVNAAVGGVLDSAKVEDKNSASSQEVQDETVENSEDSKKDAKESDEEELKEESEELEEEQKPKKKGGFQKRIEKFQKQLSVKEQELEYWKQKALGEKAPEKEAPVKESSKSNNEPNPDDFETHAAYVKAVTKWAISSHENEKAQKAKEEEVVQSYQSRLKSFHDKVDEFKTSVKDFDDVIDEVADVKISAMLNDAIVSSDLGPRLFYELSKNKSELERINSLPDYKALIEIGKFEERISKASSKKEAVSVSKAPSPISPVNAASTGKMSKSPDEMSFQEYKRYRAENRRY